MVQFKLLCWLQVQFVGWFWAHKRKLICFCMRLPLNSHLGLLDFASITCIPCPHSRSFLSFFLFTTPSKSKNPTTIERVKCKGLCHLGLEPCLTRALMMRTHRFDSKTQTPSNEMGSNNLDFRTWVSYLECNWDPEIHQWIGISSAPRCSCLMPKSVPECLSLWNGYKYFLDSKMWVV